MSNLTYYEIDKDGAIIDDFEQEPPAENNFTIVHTTPPPESMLKPRWVGGTDTGQWVDAATRAEHEARIDRETDGAIKRWAREKGKNEEYYINCGIRIATQNITDARSGDATQSAPRMDNTDIDYRRYNEYRAFVDAQKKLGKAKKDALL